MPWLNQATKRQCLHLYKQFINASRIYPGDASKLMQRVRSDFYSYEHETDENVIKKAINNGKWQLKQIEGTAKIAKYRYMKRNYEDNMDSAQS